MHRTLPVLSLLLLSLHAHAARPELVVLVADEALRQAVAPLLDHKRAEGHPVSLLYLHQISDSGRDRAESIRNALRARYLDGKLRYLLLVGGYEQIPMRLAHVAPEGVKVPYGDSAYTDLYYGNLTGDWDADGDGRYGEWGQDRPGFTTQLMVGRIPFDDPAVVSLVAARILDYQKSRGAWKRRTLLAAGTIVRPGDSAIVTELVRRRYFVPRGWDCVTFHAAGAPQASDFVLDAHTFRAALTEPAGLTFQLHHGNAHGAYVDGSSGVRFLASADAEGLASSRGPVMVSVACINGYPGGLAEQFFRHHAAAFIGATAVTAPFAGTGVQSEVEAARQLAAGRSLGQTMRAVRGRYAAVSIPLQRKQGQIHEVLRNLYAFVCYGDPTTVVNQSSAPRVRPSGVRLGAVR